MRACLWTDSGHTIQKNVTPKISWPYMDPFEIDCHEFIVLSGLWAGGLLFFVVLSAQVQMGIVSIQGEYGQKIGQGKE